jgi:hypothetical protein
VTDAQNTLNLVCGARQDNQQGEFPIEREAVTFEGALGFLFFDDRICRQNLAKPLP